MTLPLTLDWLDPLAVSLSRSERLDCREADLSFFLVADFVSKVRLAILLFLVAYSVIVTEMLFTVMALVVVFFLSMSIPAFPCETGG